LQGEYSGASLSLQERGSLWLHAIRAASETPNGNLAQELLLWSKYSTLEQLAHALAKSPPLVGLIDTLTLGAKVGANFTNALKAQLGKQNDLQTQLQPLIDRALGAQCINGTALFAAIDAWEELEEVPEQELQAMLRESLTALKEGPCPLAAQRALHMLGWLDNDAMCTLEFWIDRLPSQATPSDKEACMSKVLQSIEKVIEKHGTSGMAPVMDRLSQLPLSKDDWRTIIADMPGRAHMSDGAHTVEAINNNPALAFLDWLQTHTTTLAALPSSRAPGLGTAQAVMPTQGLFTQTVSMARQLLACTVPPMLQAIVQIKSDTMHIQIGDIDLQIASGLDRITAKTGRQTHWIGEQMYAQLKPQENANASDTFRMVLRDGTLITGTATKTGPFIVEGILSCIGAAQTPAGLAGLLQQGRALASTQFQEYGLEQHFWTAEGSFSATGLLKSNNTLDALRSLKQGLIVERSATSSLRIEHEIKDNAPHTCKVMAMGDKWQSHSQIKYRCEPDELANYPALSNVWNAIVSEDKAEAHQLIHIPPLGPVKLSSSVPFSISQQSADGWIELQSQGPTPFRWLGRMEGGRCLQFGSLHVDRQRTPAITFDAGEQADHLPITLLPVMADLLGKHLQGQYPFKPAIWQDSSRWPTAGFEGFVHRQQHGPYTFSGYLTATGRAIGILGLSNAGTSTTYDLAWSGSFMVTPTHGIVRHPIELDNLDPSFVGLEVSPTEALLPHGLVRAQFLDRNTQKSRARIDRVYFCGEGMAYTTITQSRDLIYDSPSMTRYFVGVEYSRKNKPMHIDLVINPGDGGHDFVIIRPKTYEKEKLYQMLYHDELGTKASYVIKDRQYSMVDITFPSGMQYIGQIITEQSSCKLIDKGKISFGKLSFAIETERTGRIRSIRGLNEDSTHWVDTYTSQNRAPNFAVENLVELMSGGMLLWQTHVQPHLVLRDLQAHQANAVVFSRS
ncbi:MAG TPA: hypothetical protein VFV39_12435, partial [Limnobacter sp.]|nr:hypothetical protein [Limnobacter sp.]